MRLMMDAIMIFMTYNVFMHYAEFRTTIFYILLIYCLRWMDIIGER